MTDIVLCGDPDDTSIAEALIPALSLYGGVRYSSAERILERGIQIQFNLYECEKVPSIEIPRGIILLKKGIMSQKSVMIPDGFLCVLETKNYHAASLLKDTNATVITCGTSTKDTISLAGLENTGATLSLQRNLPTLSGELLEPHDFNVSFSKIRSPHQILFVCAALLLSGVDSSGSYMI